MILEIKSFQFLVNESFFKNRILAEFMESCSFPLTFFNISFKISQVSSVRCGEEHALLGDPDGGKRLWPRWGRVHRVTRASTSALAAAQKPRGRWSTQQIQVPHILKAGRPRSKCQQIWCLMRTRFLVHRWYLLTASSPGGRAGILSWGYILVTSSPSKGPRPFSP